MLKLSLLYGVAGIIAQLFQYLTFPILSRNLSPDQFGVVSILESIMFLGTVVVTFSIERAAQRFYFDAIDGRQSAFVNAMAWLVGCGVVGVAVTAFVEIAGLSVLDSMPVGSISMMMLAAGAAGVSGLSAVYFQVGQKPLLFCCLNLLKGVGQFGLAYYLVGILGEGVKGFIISIVAANCLAAGFGMVLLPSIRFAEVSLSVIKDMLKYSAPFVPTVLGAWLLTMGGRFFLQGYATLDDVGVYFFWYKISLAYFLCSTAINTAIGPVIYQLLSEKIPGQLLIDRMIKPITMVYGIGGVAFMVISHDIAQFMGGGGYRLSPLIFSVIILGHFLSSVMGGSSDLLLSYHKLTNRQMTAFLAGSALSILINCLITPTFGVVGVILASVSGLGFIIICHRTVLRAHSLPTFSLIGIAVWGSAVIAAGAILSRIDVELVNEARIIRILLAVMLVAFALAKLRQMRMTGGHSKVVVAA